MPFQGQRPGDDQMFGRSHPMAAVGVASVALAVCTAGFNAVAHADRPCTNWRFNGYTELRGGNGTTLAFVSSDPAINGHAQQFRPDGTVVQGYLAGSPNGSGDVPGFSARFARDGDVWTTDRDGHLIDVTLMEDFNGGVDADGFAYGTQVEHVQPVGGGPELAATYITSWRSAAPLKKCADAPPNPPDVLTPEEGTPLEPFNAPKTFDVRPPYVIALEPGN